MNQETKEFKISGEGVKSLSVQFFSTFDEALEAAHDTRLSLRAYCQRNVQRRVKRWREMGEWYFVHNHQLYYGYICPDGLKVVNQCEMGGRISNRSFRVVEPIVTDNVLYTPELYLKSDAESRKVIINVGSWVTKCSFKSPCFFYKGQELN